MGDLLTSTRFSSEPIMQAEGNEGLRFSSRGFLIDTTQAQPLPDDHETYIPPTEPYKRYNYKRQGIVGVALHVALDGATLIIKGNQNLNKTAPLPNSEVVAQMFPPNK